jgi:hypothetical protein
MNPTVGDLHINASALASVLIDLPPGAMVGHLSEQAKLNDVLEEIAANQDVWGDKAGVTAGDFTALQDAGTQLAQVRTFLPAARKLVELLEETESSIVDRRERKIRAIAGSVDGRVKEGGGDDLLAKYQKTREYRSAIGVKAAKTRKKNAEADAAENADAADTTDPKNTPPQGGGTPPVGGSTPPA